MLQMSEILSITNFIRATQTPHQMQVINLESHSFSMQCAEKRILEYLNHVHFSSFLKSLQCRALNSHIVVGKLIDNFLHQPTKASFRYKKICRALKSSDFP